MADGRLRSRLRSSWAEVLIGTTCVVAAGTLVVWRGGEKRYAEIGTTVGHPVEVSSSRQSLEVTDVRLASGVQRSSGGRTVETKDRFIVLSLRTTSPGRRIETSLRCELRQGEAVVEPAILSTVVMPQPGFAMKQDLVFERPVDGLVGAQLVCHPSDIILSWSRELVVDLGLDETRRDAKPQAVVQFDELGVEEVLR